jgi:hypothetical protein
MLRPSLAYGLINSTIITAEGQQKGILRKRGLRRQVRTRMQTRILNLVYLALTFSVHIHTRHTQAGRHHQVSSSCPELGNIREMHQVPRTSRLQGPHSRRRCHLPASTSCSGRRACHKHIPVHLQSLLLPLLVQPLRLAHHVSMC